MEKRAISIFPEKILWGKVEGAVLYIAEGEVTESNFNGWRLRGNGIYDRRAIIKATDRRGEMRRIEIYLPVFDGEKFQDTKKISFLSCVDWVDYEVKELKKTLMIQNEEIKRAEQEKVELELRLERYEDLLKEIFRINNAGGPGSRRKVRELILSVLPHLAEEEE